MKSFSEIATPIRIVALTNGSVLLFILWIGPERFYYESFGTWILSPFIYTKFLPVPLDHWLILGLGRFPLLSHVLCAIPALMLFASVIAATISIRTRSQILAYTSSALITLVFGVYYYLQPLGMTYYK